MDYYDDFGRFALAAEQLVLCRELLLSSSAPRHRMAVILLDSLADALLFRRMEEAFRDSDQAWFRYSLPHYSAKKREKARRHFKERLKLVRDPSADTVLGGHPPVVTEADIDVLTIGHSYRNAAYHRDRHPAVVATIGKLFFQSVGALLVNSQWPGGARSITEEEANRLRSVGVDPDAGSYGLRMLDFRATAEGLVSSMSSRMTVPVSKVAEEFADDLKLRVEEVEDNIDYLSDGRGKMEESLERLEFRASLGDDDTELMRLKDARDLLGRKIWKIGPSEATRELYEQRARAADAYAKRFIELWGAREKTKGTLDRLADIRKVSERLPRKRSSAVILRTYSQADEELSVIEGYIDEAVAAFDDHVNNEVDRLRGG
jgi:hypothetical protein